MFFYSIYLFDFSTYTSYRVLYKKLTSPDFSWWVQHHVLNTYCMHSTFGTTVEDAYFINIKEAGST